MGASGFWRGRSNRADEGKVAFVPLLFCGRRESTKSGCVGHFLSRGQEDHSRNEGRGYDALYSLGLFFLRSGGRPVRMGLVGLFHLGKEALNQSRLFLGEVLVLVDILIQIIEFNLIVIHT